MASSKTLSGVDSSYFEGSPIVYMILVQKYNNNKATLMQQALRGAFKYVYRPNRYS